MNAQRETPYRAVSHADFADIEVNTSTCPPQIQSLSYGSNRPVVAPHTIVRYPEYHTRWAAGADEGNLPQDTDPYFLLQGDGSLAMYLHAERTAVRPELVVYIGIIPREDWASGVQESAKG